MTRGGWVAPLCLGALLAASGATPLRAQEPEIIHLDPNHPILQPPGTRPAAPEAAAPTGAPQVIPLPAQGVNAREVLSGLWFRYRALQRQGERDQAAQQMTTALEFMRREGLRAAPEIAGAFLTDARDAMEEGDDRRAQESARLAASFAPHWPSAHLALAAALLRGDHDALGAAREWWGAIRAAGGDPGSLYDVAGNALAVIVVGAGAGLFAALLLLMVRASPAFSHDLMERSAGRLSPDGARLLAWLLLVLPAVLFLPLPWILAAWTVIFAAYLRGSEKGVALLALLALVAAGPAAHLLAWTFRTTADPGARALIRSARQGPDLQEEEPLKILSRDHPSEPIFPFLLAVAYRAGGRFEEAMGMYQRVLALDPQDARAMLNLGNLHALRQDYAVALTFYQKAAQTDPHLALAHYDSHLAHLETFHLDAADRELKEARAIDDRLVTSILRRGGEDRSHRAPLDAPYPAGAIVRRALRLRLEGGARAEAAQALAAPATLAGAAGFLVALLLPGAGLAPRTGAARRCRRCGRPFCRRCQVGTKHPDDCSQCVHLFVVRDGVAPAVKTRKLEEVSRYRRRTFVVTRLLSLLAPGGGHLLGGRVTLGCALLMVWAASWMGVLLHGRLLVSPEAIAPTSSPEVLLALLAPALLAWLIGNLTTHEAAGG